MANVTKGVDLDVIDRLEDKLKLLVDVVGQLREEQAQLKQDNQRLARELEMAQEKLAEAETATSDFTLLKEERETIRTRVADMLQQLEALAL